MDRLTFPVETTPFVPLFAYEMVAEPGRHAVLLFVIRRFAPRLFDGDVVLMYLMWYGGVRTLLETYRVNNWTSSACRPPSGSGILASSWPAPGSSIRHRRGWGTPMIKPANEPPTGARRASTQPEASTG